MTTNDEREQAVCICHEGYRIMVQPLLGDPYVLYWKEGCVAHPSLEECLPPESSYSFPEPAHEHDWQPLPPESSLVSSAEVCSICGEERGTSEPETIPETIRLSEVYENARDYLRKAIGQEPDDATVERDVEVSLSQLKAVGVQVVNDSAPEPETSSRGEPGESPSFEPEALKRLRANNFVRPTGWDSAPAQTAQPTPASETPGEFDPFEKCLTCEGSGSIWYGSYDTEGNQMMGSCPDCACTGYMMPVQVINAQAQRITTLTEERDEALEAATAHESVVHVETDRWEAVNARAEAAEAKLTALEAKAGLADELLSGNPLTDGPIDVGMGHDVCMWCGWSGVEPHPESEAAIRKLPGYGHAPNCVKQRYDALAQQKET